MSDSVEICPIFRIYNTDKVFTFARFWPARHHTRFLIFISLSLKQLFSVSDTQENTFSKLLLTPNIRFCHFGDKSFMLKTVDFQYHFGELLLGNDFLLIQVKCQCYSQHVLIMYWKSFHTLNTDINMKFQI